MVKALVVYSPGEKIEAIRVFLKEHFDDLEISIANDTKAAFRLIRTAVFHIIVFSSTIDGNGIKRLLSGNLRYCPFVVSLYQQPFRGPKIKKIVDRQAEDIRDCKDIPKKIFLQWSDKTKAVI